jgi:hypothetical protein
MTINPYNSPYYKLPKPVFIQDRALYFRWIAIHKHLASTVDITEYPGYIAICKDIYIAKHSPKFRLRSHLDWAWYTPRTIAQAIDLNAIDQYYEIMLADARSDPNLWKDNHEEMILKSFYAARAGRCNLL